MAVLEYRKSAFKALGCPNIDAYNETTEQPLPRLIFACDEVAEMLDKTGADNERKKLLAQIENKLSTIARQGRAFGIQTLATRLIRENCNLASTLIIRIASRTSISFSIFMFSRSPWSNSITDMFKASARCSKIETSGKPTPHSHLLTARLETPIFSAS